MRTKEFLKKLLGRYASIGLTLMGFYNIALLALYFMRRIETMPENIKLLRVDVFLVLGAILIGLILESIRYIYHKESRPDNTEGK